MLSWLVDTAPTFYLLFGLAALGLAAWWWRTKQGKYLVAAGVAAGLVVLIFVLSLVVMTDRKRLVADVHDVINKMNKGDFEGAFTRFADQVEVKLGQQSRKLPRDAVRAIARMSMERQKVKGFHVWNVEVDKLEGATAQVSFYIQADDGPGGYAIGKASCTRVGPLDWRVSGIDMQFPGSNPQPISLPSWP